MDIIHREVGLARLRAAGTVYDRLHACIRSFRRSDFTASRSSSARAVRPIAIEAALLKIGLGWRERVTVGWFGPKGFASAIYGLMLYHHSITNADALFHLTAAVVVLSIIAHSSTDVLLARWFRRGDGSERSPQAQAGESTNPDSFA